MWADWILTGVAYGLRPDPKKELARAHHQALIRALPGESLLLGICAGLDPTAVVERMITGVDLTACPDWASVDCAATLDTLDEIGPGQRIYWLSVPLRNNGFADRVGAPLRSVAADLRDSLGVAAGAVSLVEVNRRLEQAQRVHESIPAVFQPRPATPGSNGVARSCTRNNAACTATWTCPRPPTRSSVSTSPSSPLSASVNRCWTRAASPTPTRPATVHEFPRAAAGLRRWNPMSRRYLKVQQSGALDQAASYQATLVVADVPSEGMLFPGSEIIGRIDESGLDVDWGIRLKVRSSEQVVATNRRALRNLNEQYAQRDGEVSLGVQTLDRAARDLAEYAAVLESDTLEVEAQATIMFCVAAPTGPAVTAQATALAHYVEPTGYRLALPLGCQEELWWAMHPGTPATRAVTEFAQIAASRALAATIPLASVDLGDAKGSLLALNISNSLHRRHALRADQRGPP